MIDVSLQSTEEDKGQKEEGEPFFPSNKTPGENFSWVWEEAGKQEELGDEAGGEEDGACDGEEGEVGEWDVAEVTGTITVEEAEAGWVVEGLLWESPER